MAWILFALVLVEDRVLGAYVLGACAFVLARASLVSSRLDCQTASAFAFARPFFASMNGFGALPLPAAICCIVRPEATERSSSRILSPSSLAYSSRCLI